MSCDEEQLLDPQLEDPPLGMLLDNDEDFATGVSVLQGDGSPGASGGVQAQEDGVKKKRKVAKRNNYLLDDFRKLDDQVLNGDGGWTGLYYCVCLHCERNRMERLESIKQDTRYNSSQQKLKKELANVPELKKLKFSKRTCMTHLKTCMHHMQEQGNNGGSGTPSTINSVSSCFASSDSKVSSKARRQLHIRNFVMPIMSEAEIIATEKYLLELVIDAGLPFSFVELPAFHRLIDSIRPGASKLLPYRQKISSKLLSKAAKEASQNMNIRVQKYLKGGHFGGLLIDGYKNISGLHIDSMMLAVNSTSVPLQVSTTGSEHHGLAVAKSIEVEINKYRGKCICVLQIFLTAVANQFALLSPRRSI